LSDFIIPELIVHIITLIDSVSSDSYSFDLTISWFVIVIKTIKVAIASVIVVRLGNSEANFME